MLFEIVRPRKDSNYDILVDVVSLLKSPPVAGTSKALCGVGFKASPRNAALSQDMIDAQLADQCPGRKLPSNQPVGGVEQAQPRNRRVDQDFSVVARQRGDDRDRDEPAINSRRT